MILPGSIEIWLSFEPPPLEVLSRHLHDLAPDERERAGGLRSDDIRVRFLWRRLLRRQILASYLNHRPKDLVFTNRCEHCSDPRHGKPRLVDTPHIAFSASQSGEITVVAVGTRPMGVDVQAISADFSGVAEVALTPREQAAVAAAGMEANLALATLWARKEAFLKADGIGLAVQPAAVDALGAGFKATRFAPIERPGVAGWEVASWNERGVVIALCAEGAPTTIFRAVPSDARHGSGFVWRR